MHPTYLDELRDRLAHQRILWVANLLYVRRPQPGHKPFPVALYQAAADFVA